MESEFDYEWELLDFGSFFDVVGEFDILCIIFVILEVMKRKFMRLFLVYVFRVKVIVSFDVVVLIVLSFFVILMIILCE